MTATMSDQELSLLRITEGQVTWNKEQKLALVDVLRVRHASEADMAVFFHQCRRTGLDPFRRQIYMIARQEWDSDARAKIWRQTFQTGIDGFRLIARRAAASARVEISYEDTIYVGDDGTEYKTWPHPDKPPLAVRVVVLLGESRFPATAYYREYVPMVDETEWVEENGKNVKKKTGNKVPTSMWQQRPVGQLEKCAEALALRRACPEDLSGLYEPAEMEHRDAMVHLVEGEDGVHSPAPKPAKRGKGTNWLYKIQRAKTRDELGQIYHDSKDAGEKTPEIDKAISERAAKLPPEDAPSTGQESEPEPNDSGESAPEDAQSNVQPSAEELPFVMQDRLIAAGVTTEEAARALSVDERDRILGVAAWGGDEDRAFEWAVSHLGEHPGFDE